MTPARDPKQCKIFKKHQKTTKTYSTEEPHMTNVFCKMSLGYNKSVGDVRKYRCLMVAHFRGVVNKQSAQYYQFEGIGDFHRHAFAGRAAR